MHQTTERPYGKHPNRTLQFAQLDGSSVYVPVLADLLVDLYTPGEDGTADVTGFEIRNYHGAKNAEVWQDPRGFDVAYSPIYRLLLEACQAAPTEPVDVTVDELRTHALLNGHSVARQYGRLQ